jgi:hypothetical protein
MIPVAAQFFAHGEEQTPMADVSVRRVGFFSIASAEWVAG